jgi:predicted hydrocarbon binding protein
MPQIYKLTLYVDSLLDNNFKTIYQFGNTYNLDGMEEIPEKFKQMIEILEQQIGITIENLEPEKPEVPIKKCPKCRGTGDIYVTPPGESWKCPECDGTGEVIKDGK